MVFYSAEWQPLGNKRSLASALTAITKIDQSILDGTVSIDSASIAQRMSWAAERQTTRAEDRAYSLMGLFRVNMPMLYGERERAFQRLQQEIMKLSDDQSIFCWIDGRHSENTRHGLLADSPDAFRHASKCRAYSSLEDLQPFDMSNRGLSIHLPLTATEEKDVFVAALHCPVPETKDGFLGIYLQKLASGEKQYARIRNHQLVSIASRGDWRNIYVRPSFQQETDEVNMSTHCCVLRKYGSTTPGIPYVLITTKGLKMDSANLPFYQDIVRSGQSNFSNLPTSFKMVKSKGRLSAAFVFSRWDRESLMVQFGTCADLNPGFDVHDYNRQRMPEFEELSGSFNPEPVGNTLSLQYHQVTVQAETRIEHGVKVYLMDVFIKGEPKTKDEDGAGQFSKAKKGTSSRLSKMKQMISGGPD